jgi:transcriptional regulator with XRE-family HTH domain
MVFPDELVREARQSAGLTQAELGERLGMSQSAIAKLERRGSNPTVETLDRVLRGAHTRLHISASPWPTGVDDTLIAGDLDKTPAARVAAATDMYAWARRAAKKARGAADGAA